MAAILDILNGTLTLSLQISFGRTTLQIRVILLKASLNKEGKDHSTQNKMLSTELNARCSLPDKI